LALTGSRLGPTADLSLVIIVEVREQCAHRAGETGYLLEVQLGQRLEPSGAVLGEREARGASMVGIGRALDEAFRFRSVDETDGAVVAKQEVAGDVPDRRTGGVWVALDRQQQLVLSGGEVLSVGLLLAPAQELSEAGPECEQALVIGIGRLLRHVVAR
jgi:hypothetical protein